MAEGHRPSAFFWVLLPGLLLAVLAAAFAGDHAPGFALNSNTVYRCEVGGAVFAIFYALTLTLYLAWNGLAPKRIGGGPASMDTTPQPVDASQAVDGGPEMKLELAAPSETRTDPPASKSR